MTDVPDAAVQAAAGVIWHGTEADAEQARMIARTALEAAAPAMAEHVAQKITDHMKARDIPGDPQMLLAATLRRAWHRHFGIAARVAANAFSTPEDIKRAASEAIERGDFTACFDTEPGEERKP